ncbi:MAG: hypothetical protein HOL31_02045 [Candidatus Scalindua sp.]|jgi:hypothetical protein|nr:hypothetical protein [Candidatus Scalindua sp.]MBT7349683.1 hypothetical protein [candidate division WWE3 bacterium]
MIVKTDQDSSFAPITVTITIQNKEELKGLLARMNTSRGSVNRDNDKLKLPSGESLDLFCALRDIAQDNGVHI